MLQSHENAVSEFIHLPASGCLGNTVFISPEESRFERIPLDSGGMKKARSRGRGIRSRSVFSVAIVRGCWSLCARPGCIPQRRLRPLSSINAICIGIGCNKSCKSLTAEWAPPGADTAEPSLRELWQCVNGIFCWGGGLMAIRWYLSGPLMCIYTNKVFLRDLRYKGEAVLPDTLLPGISETKQDDQGPFLCGVVVPEQSGPQEPYRGLPAPSILRGPPTRLWLQPWFERAEQGAICRLAGRERRQEQGALGGPPCCR